MSSTFNIVSTTNPSAFTLDSIGRQSGRTGEGISGAAVSSSTIVELGSSQATGLTYDQPQARMLEAWTSTANRRDHVSAQMAINSMAGDAAGRLKGLGAYLLKGYTGEAGSYQQTLLRFFGVRGSEAAAQAQEVAGVQLQATPAQKITLTLKTQSGATVELSIASGASGLSVEMKTSQTLSSKELVAVQDLAEGFEEVIKGLAEVPPRVAINVLNRFDSSAIVSLDLRAVFNKEDSESLTFAFSATAAGRSLKVGNQTGSLDLSVDFSNSQIRGDSAQREKAVSNYLAQIDVAAKRGNGDKALVDLFKNAFREIHANYPEDADTVGRRPLRDYEAAVLSGLADFKAGIKVKAVDSNPMRPGETDYFNYLATQESTLTTDGSAKLTQLRETVLEAAFHKGLKSDKAPFLTTDPRSQNYRYFQVNDRMSSRVTMEHNEFGLVRAGLEQSASKLMKIQTYEQGKLVKEDRIPEQYALIIDFLETIKNLSLDPTERQRQLGELNDRILK